MISLEKWAKLNDRLKKIGILEKDLDEHFIRSGGHGGQNVNKVSTCVALTHRPSGLSVKCQQTRFQGDNRYFARSILADKLENQILGKQSAQARERYKIKKQKQKRSKRAKQKVLADKRHHAEIKTFRKNPLRSKDSE